MDAGTRSSCVEGMSSIQLEAAQGTSGGLTSWFLFSFSRNFWIRFKSQKALKHSSMATRRPAPSASSNVASRKLPCNQQARNFQPLSA